MKGTATDSCNEALQLLHNAKTNEPFDVIIFDFTMSRMDAEELATTIKADKEIAQTSLILISSIDKKSEALALCEKDSAKYLQKPIRQTDLYKCLIETLSKSNQNHIERLPNRTDSRSKITSGALRILVAEDNVISQKVTLTQLEKLGYKAKLTTNGREVLEEFKRQKYDVVLMDIQMPEMNGYDATAAIRSFENDSLKTPIIAVTAHAMEGEREKCLAADMNDYLTKPIKMKLLKKAIEEWTKVSG